MTRVALVVVMVVALAGEARAQVGPDKQPLLDPVQIQRQAGLPLQPDGVSPLEGNVAVGERAPDLDLDGSGGRPVRLADLRGRWAVVVFGESPGGLELLKDIFGRLVSMGVRPYGVCQESWTALQSFARREQVPYPLLSDPTGEISQALGMYDGSNDVITPGLILLDPKGVVRAVRPDQSLQPAQILDLVRRSVAAEPAAVLSPSAP